MDNLSWKWMEWMGKDGEFGGSVFFAQVENGRNLCNFFRPPLSNTMNTRQQNELFSKKSHFFLDSKEKSRTFAVSY